MQCFLALADPTRRRIIELLAESERTVGELVTKFDLSAPAISQHLHILRDAGLITARTKGQSRIQTINRDGFEELETWLKKTLSAWSRSLNVLEHRLRVEDEENGKRLGKFLS